jgi:acyl carrier protein
MKPRILDLGAITQSLLNFVNTNIMAATKQIRPDDDLKSAGIDSMAMLKILLFIESEFGFWMPAEDLAHHNLADLRGLAGYIARHADASK